jgi:hypothetical protein
MSSLWVFGDSFSAEFDIKNVHQNHIDYMQLMNVDCMSYWPTLLADKLKYDVKNCARGGNSNYQIFFDFCENIDLINDGDIILIGWALLGKFIIADNNRFNNIHPLGQHYHSPISNDSLQEFIKNREQDIWENEVRHWEKLIQKILEYKNCKIIFWSGEENKLKNTKIDVTFCETMTNETNGAVQDSHLGMLGHKRLAEIFYKELSI